MSEIAPNNYHPPHPASLPGARFYSPVIGDGNVFRKITNLTGPDLPPLAQILSTFNAPLDFIDGDSTIAPGRSGIFMGEGTYTVTFDATSITLPAVLPGPSPVKQGFIFRPHLVLIKSIGSDYDQMMRSCSTFTLSAKLKMLTLTPRATEYFKWTGLDSTTVTLELLQGVTMRSIYGHVRGYYEVPSTSEGSDGQYLYGGNYEMMAL